MKRLLGVCVFFVVLTGVSLAAAKGPEVDLVDNKLSINAEAVPLGRLLRLVDMATGMTSKVPPELANRNISVKFAGLNLNDGVKKMFQGQPLDYVVIQGQGIVITAASQTGGASDSALPAYNPPQQIEPQQFNQPFVQDFPPPPGQPLPGQPQPGQPQQQPAMIQTPFGPIVNPRAQQGQQGQQPNQPLNAPGQQNPLFPTSPNQPLNQPLQSPFPTNQPNNGNPFGVNSPFGTPTTPANNPNSLFGAPPVANPPGIQQRTP